MGDSGSDSDQRFINSVVAYANFARPREQQVIFENIIDRDLLANRPPRAEAFRIFCTLLRASTPETVADAYDAGIFSGHMAIIRTVARVLIYEGLQYAAIVQPLIRRYRKC